MRKFYSFVVLFLFLSCITYAQQVPRGMKYQAVARDKTGEVLSNKKISLMISLMGGAAGNKSYYTEVHELVTNQFGLFDLVIGEGKVSNGDFNTIPWSAEDIWMQVSIKDNQQSNFTTISNSKLLAVPYAFHALTANELVPKNKGQLAYTGTPYNFSPMATASTTASTAGPTGVPSNVWSTFGNTRTNPLTDHLGTADLADLVMITNNIERLRITADGNIAIKRSLGIGANLTVDSNVNLNRVSGSTVNNGPFTVTRLSPTYLSGTLSVDLATQLNSSLTVAGITNLNSNLNVNNASPTHLTGTLRTDGITDLNSALNVNNASPTLLTGTLLVKGDATFNQHVLLNNPNLQSTSPITGALVVNGGLGIGRNLNVGGDANFGGHTSFAGAVSITDVTPSTSTTTGALTVGGGAGIGNQLNVGGATQLSNTLGVTGAATLSNTLAVTGATTLSNTLGVTGATTLSSTLGVTGAATFNGVANFNNSMNINPGAGQVVITAAGNGNGDQDNGAYPLVVQGSNQGIVVKVNSTLPDNTNNFITFKDGGGTVRGRIEGQTASDLHSDPFYQFNVASLSFTLGLSIAQEVMAGIAVVGAAAATTPCVGLGVCETVPPVSEIVASVANLVIATAQAVLADANLAAYLAYVNSNLGITYQSGAGDYAEWLPKSNTSDKISAGEIVGVKGGLIGRTTIGAEKVMVVSNKPIVLGNMPDAGQEKIYEKVAFMGQVPVKVIGQVQRGDYILPSGGNDGFGRAKHPADLTAADYAQIVGIAWSASNSSTLNTVNVAVGINSNDVSKFVAKQEEKINNQASELNELKKQMNQTNEMLAKLVPGFKSSVLKIDASLPAITNTVAMAPTQMLSKSNDVQAEATPVPVRSTVPVIKDKLRHLDISDNDIELGLKMAEERLRNNGVDVDKNYFFKKLKSDPSYKSDFINKMKASYSKAVQSSKQIDAQFQKN